METRKRSERPKKHYAEQTTEDSISPTSKTRRRKQMDGEGKGKRRGIPSWAYRNEKEMLLSTWFPSIFAKTHLLSTCTQP